VGKARRPKNKRASQTEKERQFQEKKEKKTWFEKNRGAKNIEREIKRIRKRMRKKERLV